MLQLLCPASSNRFPLAMDTCFEFPLPPDTKPMYSLLAHPYSPRRCQSTTMLSMGTRSPHGPTIEKLGLWHPSMGSDDSSVTAFVSVTGSPSEKLDAPPLSMPTHEYPYVKHSSGVTVILSGHRAGTSLPLYPSGSLISGVVVLSKVETTASLDVKVSAPFVSHHFGACQAHPRSSWKASSLYARFMEAEGVAKYLYLIS